MIVPPAVYERCRLAVRTASFALVAGRLERREGVINVVAASVERLALPADAEAAVRQIEPPADREAGRDRPPTSCPPPALVPAPRSPRWRRRHRASAVVADQPCKIACRTYVLSEAVHSLAAR